MGIGTNSEITLAGMGSRDGSLTDRVRRGVVFDPVMEVTDGCTCNWMLWCG